MRKKIPLNLEEFFGQTLSQLQVDLNHYLQSLSQFIHAIEKEQNNKEISNELAHIAKSWCINSMTKVLDTQRVLEQKSKLFHMHFSQYTTATKQMDYQMKQPTHPAVTTINEDIPTLSSNVETYYRFNRPISYQFVRLNKSAPTSPWLANNVKK